MKVDDFLKDSGTKLYIEQDSFIEYMKELGYRCSNINGSAELVRVIDNIVYQEDTNTLYNFISDMMINHKGHRALFRKNPTSYFGNKHIYLLPSVEDNILRDTADTAYIPFENGVMCVTKDNITLRSYGNITKDHKLIYKDSIIQRKVHLVDWHGAFATFVRNAVLDEGFKYACRAIGYLCHTYKDPSIAKIIAFVDVHDRKSDYANGGTGKSLIAKDAIRQIRHTNIIDGKQFRKDDQFRFQGVDERTSVVAVEDLNRETDLSIFFNACTGDFQVRNLHQKVKIIPFDKSPKISITANQALLLRGASEQRRVCSIGFYDHYNNEHTPIMEFGKLFFSHEWSDQDWDEFYSFMFMCIQEYLKFGIDDYALATMQEKALIQTYGEGLFIAVKSKQEKIAIYHTQSAIIQEFEEEFTYTSLETNRTKYNAVKDIMTALGWECKSGTKETYTIWAIPEDEERFRKNGAVEKKKRSVFWYVKK